MGGVVDQRPGERDAPLRLEGEVGGPKVRPVGEVQRFQKLQRASLPFASGDTGVEQRPRDVLPRAELRQQRRRLKDETEGPVAQPCTLGIGKPSDRAPL